MRDVLSRGVRGVVCSVVGFVVWCVESFKSFIFNTEVTLLEEVGSRRYKHYTEMTVNEATGCWRLRFLTRTEQPGGTEVKCFAVLVGAE